MSLNSQEICKLWSHKITFDTYGKSTNTNVDDET